MGLERSRPSRVIKSVNYVTNDLPTAANNTLTTKIDGLPNRGIIRRMTMTFVDNAVFPSIANSIDGFLVHRLGSTTSSGVNTVTDAHIDTLVCQCSLDWEGAGLAGSGATYTTSRAVRSVILTPMQSGQGTANASTALFTGVGYDVAGDIKGPVGTDGELYFTILSAGTNFQTYAGVSCRLEVEIEPCF